MYQNFFRHIDIDPNNAHVLNGNASDLQKECEDFEKKISDAGGIQLFIGGLLSICCFSSVINFCV